MNSAIIAVRFMACFPDTLFLKLSSEFGKEQTTKNKDYGEPVTHKNNN